MAQVYESATLEAAKIASQSPEMDAAAELVLKHVRASAAGHRDTGAYDRGLHIETAVTRRGVHDRLIIAETENDDAQLIEFGGVVRDTGRVIPGLHIMRNALNSIPEVS